MSPFFFPSAYEPLARPLEVCGEAHGVRGDTGLTGQVFEQASVGVREVILAGTRGEQEFPYRLVLVCKR